MDIQRGSSAHIFTSARRHHSVDTKERSLTGTGVGTSPANATERDVRSELTDPLQHPIPALKRSHTDWCSTWLCGFPAPNLQRQPATAPALSNPALGCVRQPASKEYRRKYGESSRATPNSTADLAIDVKSQIQQAHSSGAM